MFNDVNQEIKEVLDALTLQKLKDVHRQAYIKHQGIYGQIAKFDVIATCYFGVDTFRFSHNNCPQQRLLNMLNMIKGIEPKEIRKAIEYHTLIELFSGDSFDPKIISDDEAKELVDKTISTIKKNLAKYIRQSEKPPQTDNLEMELDQRSQP